MPVRISVFNSPELQGLIVSMKGFSREVQAQIRRATKAAVDPMWRGELERRSQTTLEQRVIGSTARTAVSNQNVTLRAAGVGKTLSGRAKPVDIIAGTEFGADREKTTTYTQRSKNGKPYRVTRHTRRQFAPRRRTGYVVFPSLATIIPRIAALWVQTTVRTFYEITEKR